MSLAVCQKTTLFTCFLVAHLTMTYLTASPPPSAQERQYKRWCWELNNILIRNVGLALAMTILVTWLPLVGYTSILAHRNLHLMPDIVCNKTVSIYFSSEYHQRLSPPSWQTPKMRSSCWNDRSWDATPSSSICTYTGCQSCPTRTKIDWSARCWHTGPRVVLEFWR